MKLIFGIIGCVAMLMSCRTSKEAMVPASLGDIAGEWNIETIEGENVTVTEGGVAPFIGIDVDSGRVYGCSGCNRIMTKIDVTAPDGTLEFGRMASTMMACPDMDTENRVLGALSRVKGYKMMHDGRIVFCDGDGTPLMILSNRL